MLQKACHLPLRKLVLAMPLTCVIVAVATTRSPTSAGPGRSYSARSCRRPTPCSLQRVTNPRVPRVIGTR